MKITVEKIIDIQSEIKALGERHTREGKVIEAIQLPAKTGYWIGRLEDWADPIVVSYQKAQKKLVKELGEPVLKDDKETGAYKLKQENNEKYSEENDKLLAIEEEWTKDQFEFELFDGLSLPASFMGAISCLVKEPK